ncbi:MAG TPA: hypothetical protein VIV60_34650 [Polyangiaceae bacterium]
MCQLTLCFGASRAIAPTAASQAQTFGDISYMRQRDARFIGNFRYLLARDAQHPGVVSAGYFGTLRVITVPTTTLSRCNAMSSVKCH